ncbi:hypothetical protein [Enterobacter soli]|uniref:hypothetical protein n=1 Tax=Enterobacter soli TaxID=885040 RepID=UPI002F40A611
MSTITREFTKEQLISRIHQVTAINKYRISRDPDADGLAMDNELLAIALASLEAEPVAYVDPFSFNNFSVYRAGETDNKRMGRAWMWANPDAGLIPVYTAPPEPASVPTFDEWLEIRGNKPLGWVKDAMRESYDACRAAMLQGAEPVTTAYKLRDAVETIRNSGIAIDAEKILAERDVLNTPDCWCRTCRPVKLNDMRFVVCPDCVNKRCPHANDHRNACTGSNEPGQEGGAYPAAPQQEVKP